ncbi:MULTISPECIES: RNA polymerase sigma factor [unclassified Myxococcus]|uniref:RNA polymerase sigma factor n=2 Tax=Myxococcaceae TaxID=31 RepID=UPI0011441E91|nr:MULTISPECIES: RNA polymerase sigma factor [unclassified Myxococcus]
MPPSDISLPCAFNPMDEQPSESRATELEARIPEAPVPMLERHSRRQEGRPHSMSTMRSGQSAGDLAEQHRKWLRIHAKKLCGNPHDAEDLVQETCARFIKQYRDGRPLPDREASGRILTRTLVNAFKDQLRRNRVRERNALDPLLPERSHSVSDAEPPLLSEAITIEAVTEALQALSPKMQKTYKLMAEGKPYKEIANDCGIPVSTVGKRLHDIRLKLRKALSSRGN